MCPRLAWFSPVAPVRSGISAYTAELLPRLAEQHAIDVFVDDSARAPEWTALRASGVKATQAAGAGLTGAARVLSAHDFVTRQALAPYDLVVYQLGNAGCHEFMWAYLLRYPGLVVLHDVVLHHSRARQLLRQGRDDDYAAEFAFSHPDVDQRVAQIAVAGFAGSSYYLWPLSRVPLAAARLAAVHEHAVAGLVRDAHPNVPLRVIPMGVRAPRTDARLAAGRPVGETLFACFGLVTEEKRIPQVLRAVASVRRAGRRVRLALVGPLASHYDVRAEVEKLGLGDAVTITGFVDDAALDAWLTAADVCLCLRWPTARETSASWLRCLASGKPTVITDLLQTTAVPTLDPRTWTVMHAREDATAASVPPAARDAVAVSIDILDEDHSLGLAVARLVDDAALRERLGQNARAWWAAHHTLEHMAEAYHAAIDEARARPDPVLPEGWPAHLRDDGTRRVSAIVDQFDVSVRW
jgi:glycosyltransferase involved in cell wall biosynthesis